MTELLREHGYNGSVDLVKRRLRELRPPSTAPLALGGRGPTQADRHVASLRICGSMPV